MAGRETGNSRAICPAGNAPRRSRSSTARRVGSASAWKVAPVEYVAERLRIIGNYMVPHLSCQPPPAALLVPAIRIPVGISCPPTSRHTHVPCPRIALAVVILDPCLLRVKDLNLLTMLGVYHLLALYSLRFPRKFIVSEANHDSSTDCISGHRYPGAHDRRRVPLGSTENPCRSRISGQTLRLARKQG